MACDCFGEYIVREVRDMMHNNLNKTHIHFLGQVISSLIMTFRTLRKKMWDECEFYVNMHSSTVTTHADVQAVAAKVLGYYASISVHDAMSGTSQTYTN